MTVMDERLPTPSPRALARQLLQELLPTGADFDRLCVDYFPEVHARFTFGMDRVAKTNLLLALASSEAIVQRLKTIAIEPTKAQLNLISQIIGDVKYKKMRQLEEDLEAACNEKESLVSISADTSVVDRRILLLRREQRRGPQLAEGELLSERYKLSMPNTRNRRLW